MHGGETTSPVLILNCPWEKLHSTTSLSPSPSDNEPGPWVQASSVTKNSPSTLNTARVKSSFSTLKAPPTSTSEVLHNSILLGIDSSLDGIWKLMGNRRRAAPLAALSGRRQPQQCFNHGFRIGDALAGDVVRAAVCDR